MREIAMRHSRQDQNICIFGKQWARQKLTKSAI